VFVIFPVAAVFVSVVACCFMFSAATVTSLICWFIQPQSKFQFVMFNQLGGRFVLINEMVIICTRAYYQ